jgi:D-3-phosphoglycerate dehydrogenase
VVAGHEPQGAELRGIAGVMKRTNPDVNMVSAPVIARERGIELDHDAGQVRRLRRLHQAVVDKRDKTRSIAGTVFSDGKPRFIQIKGINIDAEIGSTCSTPPTRTCRASSARWARPWARTA